MTLVPLHRLTRYECARIIGIRASQIGTSAPVLIDLSRIPLQKQSNFLYIAALELRAGVLDVIVHRPLPHNEYTEVNIRDLRNPDDLDALIAMYE
jgi:DNA-directed RNA polymerase subunit K/omega